MNVVVDDRETLSASRFRRFRVARRTQESASIVSFDLVPVDGGALTPFVAGQYVTVRLPLPSGERLLRTYSLSGDPADNTRWRISVKHERGGDAVPAGRGSSHLHERVQAGDELELAGPSGAFVCGDEVTRPVVLMSGGVGLTPLVSMLHRLRAMDGAHNRRVYFIHACENGAVHAFRHEVETVAAAHPNVHVHVCYRLPSAEDRAMKYFDSEGLISRLGIERGRIHYEFFGPATVLEDNVVEAPLSEKPHAEIRMAIDTETTIRFHPEADPVAWDPACGSLLEFAEQHGYAPAFSCRIGVCNTCVTSLVDGKIEYTEEPLEPPSEGTLLLCCAKPAGSVTLALSDDAKAFE